MSTARRPVPARRLILLAAAAAPAVLFSGCGLPAATQQGTSVIVIAASATSNEPEPVLGPPDVGLLRRNAASASDATAYIVDPGTAPPRRPGAVRPAAAERDDQPEHRPGAADTRPGGRDRTVRPAGRDSRRGPGDRRPRHADRRLLRPFHRGRLRPPPGGLGSQPALGCRTPAPARHASQPDRLACHLLRSRRYRRSAACLAAAAADAADQLLDGDLPCHTGRFMRRRRDHPPGAAAAEPPAGARGPGPAGGLRPWSARLEREEPA